MKFGIIGLGRFGKLWAEALISFGEVITYDKKNSATSIQDVTSVDILFITVPICEFESCCHEIKPYIHATTVIADCCSVKVYPVSIMQKIFPRSQSIMALHPLFGPDSVRKSGGLLGHKIVLCPIQCDQTQRDNLESLFIKMGLTALITTPEEHDQQMANSQGLVHFIGRGLSALNVKQQALSTPDFQALLNINSMVMNDSNQLFLDMHRYNPYAKEIRKKILNQLIKLEEEINHEKN